jgi:hypothetical protein
MGTRKRKHEIENKGTRIEKNGTRERNGNWSCIWKMKVRTGMEIVLGFGKMKESRGMGIAIVFWKWNWDPLVMDLEK